VLAQVRLRQGFPTPVRPPFDPQLKRQGIGEVTLTPGTRSISRPAVRGAWWPGLQRSWRLLDDGRGWLAEVEYVVRHDGGQGKHLGGVPADRVRLRLTQSRLRRWRAGPW
jgi:hypothetical protein